MPKVGFHGHVEEAYLRFIEKKLKEKRAAMGINPLIRDIYVKIESQEAKSGAPLSPILSPYGVNVSEFVNQFNKQSEQSEYGVGVKIPTVISIFENKTFKFYYTTVYSYYIASNNNNKYKAIKFHDMYKKFLIVLESKKYGKKRVWSVPHELYSKTEIKALNYFFLTRRRYNKKKQKRKNRKKTTEVVVLTANNNILEDKEMFKNLLTNLQGNRLLLYVKLKNLIKGGVFKPEVNNTRNYESLIAKHNDVLLGNYNKKHKNKYKIRFYKLRVKFLRNFKKWQEHRYYFEELRIKKKIKSYDKKQVLKFTYNNNK